MPFTKPVQYTYKFVKKTTSKALYYFFPIPAMQLYYYMFTYLCVALKISGFLPAWQVPAHNTYMYE